MHDLLESNEYVSLEKKYPFLSRAREHFHGLDGEKFVVVDIETTGLDYTASEIIEIAGIKAEGGEVQDVFNTLVKPKGTISSEIIRLTGITGEMVDDCPSIDEVAPRFLQFIDRHILVAHNADFDISFLKHHLNKKFDNQVVCTVKTARFLLPNLSNHKLHTVAQYFGIENENRHRALGDVEATYGVWKKMIPLLREKGIYKKEDLIKIPG